MEAERDDAVSQLLDLQDARRELQAQLSAKAAELRVSEGTVKQLEADMKQLEIDLAEARRLQRAATTGTVEMLPLPQVTQSQALATSISRMTLGSTQSPSLYSCCRAACTDAGGNILPSYRCTSHRTPPRLSLRLADRAWGVYLSSASGIRFLREGLPKECQQSRPVPLSIPHLCTVATAWLPR